MQAQAYSYRRFSSMEQSKGATLKRQDKLRNEWLKRNGLTLDESLIMTDAGISGFRGKHRHTKNALGEFLEKVREGRVKPGSYLIVESLDRLTREELGGAVELVLALINSGIRIVQLIPQEFIYQSPVEPMSLMLAIMELSRGHGESKTKSDRVGDAWARKKKDARTGKIMTKRCPGWLYVSHGKFCVYEHHAETIRNLYKLCVDGWGANAIMKKFNEEKIPVPGCQRSKTIGKHWTLAYISRLFGRIVLGELQSYKGIGKLREKDGEPIIGYYPAIVSEELYYAALGARNDRSKGNGRPCKKYHPLFTGILFDALTGSTMVIAGKGPRSTRSYVPTAAKMGLGGKYLSFPVDLLEEAILGQLREINPADVLPTENKFVDELAEVSGRLEHVVRQIANFTGELEKEYSEAVMGLLRKAEDEKKHLVDHLSELRQKASSPASEAFGESKTLIDVLKDDNSEVVRRKLRSVLLRVIESIYMYVYKGKKCRIAMVQIWFSSGAHRLYLIQYQQSRGGGNSGITRPMKMDVASIPCGPESEFYFDLRNTSEVKRLESFLKLSD